MNTKSLTELTIVSPTMINSKPVLGSQLVGKALELMISSDPLYDSVSQSFAIPENQVIKKNRISLCSLQSNIAVLFNWTSSTKEEFSVVVLSTDIEFYKEIKKCFDKKSNFII